MATRVCSPCQTSIAAHAQQPTSPAAQEPCPSHPSASQHCPQRPHAPEGRQGGLVTLGEVCPSQELPLQTI